MAEESAYSPELIAALRQSILPDHSIKKASYAEFCDEINYLIVSDFNSLVNILYRMDVSESRINAALGGEPGKDAARIIADLMLERHLEKIKTRKQFNSNQDIPDEDKW